MAMKIIVIVSSSIEGINKGSACVVPSGDSFVQYKCGAVERSTVYRCLLGRSVKCVSATGLVPVTVVSVT